MRKLFTKITILLILAAMAVPAIAEAESTDILKQMAAAAPSAKDVPEEDAVVLLIEHTISINKKGQVKERFHRIVKFFNDVGMRGYSDPRIAYLDKKEKLVVHTSRTFMPDGTIVSTPPNGYNQVTPPTVARYPDFLNLQQMVVTQTGLEPGALVETDYTLNSKVIQEPFFRTIKLKDRNPTKKYILKLEYYKDNPYHIFTSIKPAKKQKSADNGKIIEALEFNNIPASPRENLAPTQKIAGGTVLISEIANWKELSLALGEKFESACRCALSAKKGEELTKDAKNKLEKFIKIADYVKKSYSTVHVNENRIAWNIRPAVRVLKTGYGTELEVIALLAAMAENSGLRVSPAFITHKNLFEEKFPSINQFEHLAALIEMEEGKYLYSPRKHRFITPHNQKILLLGSDKVLTEEEIFPDAPENNTFAMNIEIDLTKQDKASLTASIQVQGNYYDLFSFTKNKKAAENFFKRAVKGSKNIKITDRKSTDNSLVLKGKAEADKPLKGSNKVKRFSLPALSGSPLNQDIGFSAEKRYSPLVLGGPHRKYYAYKIKIPKGFITARSDLKKTIKSSAGNAMYKIKQNGQYVEVTREIELFRPVYQPNEWKNLKDLISLWQDENFRTIYLVPTSKSEK